MKTLTVTALALVVSLVALAQLPESEYHALKDLYQATQGDQWNTSWDLNANPNTWQGVTITNNHVTEVRLLFNNLDGTIPASIADLTHLKTLELSFNKIAGTLPVSLGTIKSLEVLALNGNFIEGVIPHNFSKLESLKQLHLSSNLLSGSVPSNFDQIETLEVFNVFQNNLTGAIPVTMTRNRNLKEFIIAENNFDMTNEVSVILLQNSATVDLNSDSFIPSGKQVIAIETEEN